MKKESKERFDYITNNHFGFKSILTNIGFVGFFVSIGLTGYLLLFFIQKIFDFKKTNTINDVLLLISIINIATLLFCIVIFSFEIHNYVNKFHAFLDLSIILSSFGMVFLNNIYNINLWLLILNIMVIAINILLVTISDSLTSFQDNHIDWGERRIIYKISKCYNLPVWELNKFRNNFKGYKYEDINHLFKSNTNLTKYLAYYKTNLSNLDENSYSNSLLDEFFTDMFAEFKSSIRHINKNENENNELNVKQSKDNYLKFKDTLHNKEV